MTWESGSSGEVTGGDILSLVAGFACCFVGVVELLFGFKCNGEKEGDVEGGNQNPRAAGATSEPTLTVNLTPNQVAQGANWAAQNPGTVAAVGYAAAGAANASGGGANPFFGNQHLSNAR